MASYNKVILMGNLTRDPEMRVTPSELAIAKIGLAVNRQYRTRDGEKREEVTFVDVDAFGKDAELISRYLKKGDPLMLEGRLNLNQWEDKDGNKQSKLRVVLERFQFIGGARSDSDSGGYDAPPARQTAPSADSRSDRRSAPADDVLEDDVPF